MNRKGDGMLLNPSEIERRSMEIIEEELLRTGRTVSLPEEIRSIVRRVIHTTADFSFAENMRFTPGVIRLMRDMLSAGAAVITDTNMALAGINKTALRRLGATAQCLMADEEVAMEARERGVTRALVSMERAMELPGPKLFVCGNAPTFLLPLLEAETPPAGVAVIGVPVGFVNVTEMKERLWQSVLPCIVAMGRRGGSNVAAAIVNALMYGAEVRT